MPNVGTFDGEDWWEVICAIASSTTFGYNDDCIDETLVRIDIEKKGFSKDAIEKALEWLTNASLCGNLSEIFSMFQPIGTAVRIASPLEKVCLSEKLWRQLEYFRDHGILSSDLLETVLEGIRVVDTRDWDEEEIRSLIIDIVSSSSTNTAENKLKRLFKSRRTPELYS